MDTTNNPFHAILRKLENSTGEAALATPRRPEIIRRDVVQSQDDTTKFYVVDTVGAPPHEDTPGLEGDTKWKILFPTDNSFGNPIHTDPLYFLVFFYIKQEYVDEFIDLIIEEGVQVHKEEFKVIRFDLWQSLDNPTEFVVLEVVQDWAGIEEHHAKQYYQKVRDALVEMQDKPRSHDKGYKVLFSRGYNEKGISG